MTTSLTGISPEAALEVIERLSEAPPGYRRAHARGIVVRGHFQASPQATKFSTAQHLQGANVPCLVRFSNASAHPFHADTKVPPVLGMAVQFQISQTLSSSLAAINLSAFPAATPDEFIQFAEVQKPGRNGKPNWLRVLWHIATHPHILPGIKAAKSLKPAASFAAETYHGLHTYFFVNERRERQPFRYRWLPHLQLAPLTSAAQRKLPEQYLLNELRERLVQAPLVFDLVAQLPAAQDELLKPNRPWPPSRATVTMGTLTLERPHEDQSAVEGVVFDPAAVVSGLEISDDPILKFRSRIYGLSFDRRAEEPRTLPAPEDMRQ